MKKILLLTATALLLAACSGEYSRNSGSSGSVGTANMGAGSETTAPNSNVPETGVGGASGVEGGGNLGTGAGAPGSNGGGIGGGASGSGTR